MNLSAAGIGVSLAAISTGQFLSRARGPEVDWTTASVDVMEQGTSTWRTLGTSVPAGGASEDKCTIMVRWQSTGAELRRNDSHVRVKGLSWVRLGASWGVASIQGDGDVVPYSRQAGESLFYFYQGLNQQCSKYRRYRFKLEGKVTYTGNRKFVGITRELYFPSSNGWTRQTRLDLGYVDLCMLDASKCNGPYYPGGNQTPMPPGKS